MAKRATSGSSFKTSYNQYKALMGDLDNKKYSSCYLLMGEEDYFIDKIVTRLSTEIVAEEERDFSQVTLYGKECQVGEVMGALLSYPMLSDYNVVIVKEADKLKQLEQLQHYFKKPISSTIFILCYKGGTMDKRSALYKRIAENGVVLESTPARDYEIGEWIETMIRSKGVNIEPLALNMLVEHLGTSLSKIENEVEKLLTRINPNDKIITAQHIEDNIGISKDFNNFELTKALSEGNWKKSIIIIQHFASNPKDNPIVVTISQLFTHFQRIFTLGLIVWNSTRKKTTMPSDSELSQRLKLPTPFFLREYREAIKIYPTAKSFKIMGYIRQSDAKAKGIETGSATHGDILLELIEKIKNN